MAQATRKGDSNTGHDACPPASLSEGSPDVFINGKPAGRVDDKYEAHECISHPSHQDFIADGSSTVFINGKKAGRVGDVVKTGGSVRDGSADVFIGG